MPSEHRSSSQRLPASEPEPPGSALPDGGFQLSYRCWPLLCFHTRNRYELRTILPLTYSHLSCLAVDQFYFTNRSIPYRAAKSTIAMMIPSTTDTETTAAVCLAIVILSGQMIFLNSLLRPLNQL